MRIGITTTVPIEAILAGGHAPVDLNNLFIGHPERDRFIERAERDGYPVTVCGWVKGIYGAVLSEGIETVVVVAQGDCSNTQALSETLELAGVTIIPFSYPYGRDRSLLAAQIEVFCRRLGTDVAYAEEMRASLSRIREKLRRIDDLTWQTGKFSGAENHIALVSSSDMLGDPGEFDVYLDGLLEKASRREAPEGFDARLRFGFVGVPPINADIYDFIKKNGASVVFNEVQRQFAMLSPAENLVEQYSLYTYPYDVFGRIADVEEQIRVRRLDGIIHYTQAFCFRQIEDLILRRRLAVPILSIEGNLPGPLSAQNRLRVEAFIEQLRLSRGSR
ncbi:MAG: 2-hydroxyacyl-CoA dehydratase [Candidatus Coatesbacteria bacterium]|nr:2-hydroxyacyl-CoA dehydratase [Candidatus Coatesbacteria bacterium]